MHNRVRESLERVMHNQRQEEAGREDELIRAIATSSPVERTVARRYPSGNSPEIVSFRYAIARGLRGNACERCGRAYDGTTFDFHHHTEGLRGAMPVSQAIRTCAERYFWEKLIPEVQNWCLFLCRKCHIAAEPRKKRA